MAVTQKWCPGGIVSMLKLPKGPNMLDCLLKIRHRPNFGHIPEQVSFFSVEAEKVPRQREGPVICFLEDFYPKRPSYAWYCPALAGSEIIQDSK